MHNTKLLGALKSLTKVAEQIIVEKKKVANNLNEVHSVPSQLNVRGVSINVRKPAEDA